MTENAMHERRASPRVAVALELQLARKVGQPVTSRTLDLSTGGARVASDRPLRIFEELQFEVELGAGGPRLHGIARVLRQDRHDIYALRFEQVDAATRRDLETFVDERSVSRR